MKKTLALGMAAAMTATLLAGCGGHCRFYRGHLYG